MSAVEVVTRWFVIGGGVVVVWALILAAVFGRLPWL